MTTGAPSTAVSSARPGRRLRGVSCADSTGDAVGARRRLDGASAEWIRQLKAPGPAGERASSRLHAVLLSVARSEVRRRAPRLQIAGVELDDIAHQAAADALLAVTRRLDDFRGESRFTTWAYAFVVFEVSSKLGRHFWRTPTVALDAEDWDRLPDRFGLDPARQAEWGELVAALRAAVDDDLTPHQRRLFVAIVLNGYPLDSLALELGTNRNAIYKALFDARRKLRRRLAAAGHHALPAELPA